MQTFPQAIQELENQLTQTKGITQIPILKKLADLHKKNHQCKKTVECGKQLLKLVDNDNIKTKSKITALLIIGIGMCCQGNYTKAHYYFQQVKLLNEGLGDQESWIEWHFAMIDLWIAQEDSEASQKHLDQLFKMIPKSNLSQQLTVYRNLGILKKKLGKYEQAMKNFFIALQFAEKIDSPKLLDKTDWALILFNIASIYNQQNRVLSKTSNEDNQMLEYFYKALALAEETKFNYLLLAIYIQLGINKRAKKKYDEAFQYYQKALAIAKTMDKEENVLICNMNIANIYQIQTKHDLAIKYYNEALEMALKLDLKKGIMISYMNLGNCYSKKGNPNEAIPYLKQALLIAEGFNSRNLWNIYAMLANAYKFIGDADAVFDYMNKQIDLRNKMFTAEKEKSIVEMQTRYETEKKDEEAKRLRDLEQVKSRFFSQITHEFRTPLTLITGPVQQLLDRPKQNPPTYSALQNQLSLVQRNTHRLSRLVNQLLDLSKLESGKMEVQKKHGDIIAFVQLIIDAFQALAKEQNIHLDFHTSMRSLEANFDEDKLEKVLYNLLSNAFKFTPSKGKISLQLDLQNPNSSNPSLQIQLQDTGRGITAEKLPHIFDRFYQADSSSVREAEGTGIGLSLVKELLELQGGNIEVNSQMGKGTTFHFQLPLELSQNIAADAVPDIRLKGNYALEKTRQTNKTKLGKTKASTTTNSKTKNVVLVVEDNADMQVYIQSILSPHYKILSAMDGEEGVQMALEHIPDLIVSDVMMPKKDGYMLCKELKINEKTNHIPIVLLTAKAALSSRIEGLEQGADAYLSKPFSPKELLLNITNLIKVRKELQEKYTKIIELTDNNETKDSMKDTFLKKLIETIEAHIDDFKLSAESLSAYMYMSRTQIHRKLRALTNYSTTEFIRLIRLKKAKTMIENQIGTVTEIAYDVGFSSPAYFTKCFKKQFGVSPSKWKG